MKRSTTIAAAMIILSFVLWKCSSRQPSVTSSLPQNVLASCTLSADTFKTWFKSGQVTANGLVTPANSVTFPKNNTNCDFYKWSERMFLWVTSPLAGKTVLESPEFYNVSPEDSAGNRVLIPNAPGKLLHMSSHISKSGASRLPVVQDKKGNFFEIEDTNPATKARVKDAANKVVEVAQVKAEGNSFVFLDAAGKTIDHPKAIIEHKNNHHQIVHRFMAGNRTVLLDENGNVVQSEAGQATGDVLMSQGGSLVYYLTMVNDVYAWYLNLSKNTGLMSKQFPTTATDRDAIYAYALLNHVTLPDPNALAMEFKTSWVLAGSLKDTTGYVIISAVIPTYDTSNPKEWKPKGDTTARMALVGAHVVGSVAGHPEMIWSTFEHQNNTPNASYAYLDQSGHTQIQPQDTGTGWLFSNNASDTAVNHSHMVDTSKKGKTSDIIYATPGHTISASNTLQILPWGSAPGVPPNPGDTSASASNSEILSINNTIHQLLAAGDVRKNYILIGATWTQGGTAPNGISYGTDKTPGVSVGTSVVANSTMETYFQSTSNSCFSCHSAFTTPVLTPDTISHVFAAIQVFPGTAALKKSPAKSKH